MALIYLNEACRRHASTNCYEPRCNPRATYDRREVELMLVALWNDDVIQREEVVLEGMPRASVNPATLGNGLASMIDMRRAMRALWLSSEVTWALQARYGHGWTIKEIAHRQGLEVDAVESRVARAVTKLQNWLNGKDYEEEEDE